VSVELFNKLLEYIDAAIEAKSEQSRQSSDGGLAESVVKHRVRDELFEIVIKEVKS
jgi:hypothetical protein